MKINNVEFVTPLEDILDELRAELKANRSPLLEKQPIISGHNIQCQCIYHSSGAERKPSMGIDMNTGIVHCFACGEVKDLPEFVSNCFEKNDKGAFGWNWLLKNFMSIEAGGGRNVKLNITRDDNAGASGDNNTSYISEDILDQYRYYHPYWEERGITDENIIELFDLGYDKETKSITFPVRDIKGNCLFVARRNVHTKFFNYPKGVKKPLYGLYELAQHWVEYEIEEHFEDGTIGINKHKNVFVCESMIDSILLWQAGYYAVALNGTGNSLQMQQLRELPCRALIIATDNDNAGWDAYDKIKKFVKNKICYRVIFPKGRKDIGEMTQDEIVNIKWQL